MAFGVSGGFRVIDQDDRFSTWMDRLSAKEAQDLCALLNKTEAKSFGLP